MNINEASFEFYFVAKKSYSDCQSKTVFGDLGNLLLDPKALSDRTSDLLWMKSNGFCLIIVSEFLIKFIILKF